MRVGERYLAPVLRVEDVSEDFEWLEQNFRRFLEFMYSEHPSWKYMVNTSPENYAEVARSKGLPVYRVGTVPGEKLRLKRFGRVRIIYVDDGGVAVPLFIVDGDEFIVV